MFESYSQFPCPCCGHEVFRLPPGHHETCPICAWEDDIAQLRFPGLVGGANPCSLIEAQDTYQQCGAATRRRLALVREPLPSEHRDPAWRPLDPARDNPERPSRDTGYANSYPYDDPTVLYYWRPTYWRRIVG